MISVELVAIQILPTAAIQMMKNVGVEQDQTMSVFYFDRRFNELEEQHAVISRDLASLHGEHQQIMSTLQLILDAINKIVNPTPEKATSLGLSADAPIQK